MIPRGFIATIAEFKYFPVQIRGKKRLAVPPLGLRNPTQTGLNCKIFCAHFYNMSSHFIVLVMYFTYL